MRLPLPSSRYLAAYRKKDSPRLGTLPPTETGLARRGIPAFHDAVRIGLCHSLDGTVVLAAGEPNVLGIRAGRPARLTVRRSVATRRVTARGGIV